MAKLTEVKLSINLTTIILIVFIALLLAGGGYWMYRSKIDKKNNEIEAERKLREALTANLVIYQNKEKEWVAEKLTLQTSIKNLETLSGEMTATQKELLRRLKNVENQSNVIAAALIKTNVTLDSLIADKVVVDTTKKTVAFRDSTKNLQYEFVAFPVLPAYVDVKPTLTFKKFSLPNTQYIEFHWKDEKKKGYPVSFSVSNSNDYFKTIDIASYIIPTAGKEDLSPTGWQKFTKWAAKNSKTLMYIGIGGAGGAAAVMILNK